MLQGEHLVLGRDVDLVGPFFPKPSYLLSSTYDCSGAIVNGKGQAIRYCRYNGIQWQLYECAFYDVFTALKKEVCSEYCTPALCLAFSSSLGMVRYIFRQKP